MTNHKSSDIKSVSTVVTQNNVSRVDEFNLAVVKEGKLDPGACLKSTWIVII